MPATEDKRIHMNIVFLRQTFRLQQVSCRITLLSMSVKPHQLIAAVTIVECCEQGAQVPLMSAPGLMGREQSGVTTTN